jgi:hypothetical protein
MTQLCEHGHRVEAIDEPGDLVVDDVESGQEVDAERPAEGRIDLSLCDK